MLIFTVISGDMANGMAGKVSKAGVRTWNRKKNWGKNIIHYNYY